MIADLQNMNVTVLMGGDSAEREISLKSGTAVADALESAGARVTRLDTAAKGWHRDLPVETFVFNLLHGVGGEDGVSGKGGVGGPRSSPRRGRRGRACGLGSRRRFGA